MNEAIIQQDLSNEFHIFENCYITELSNTPKISDAYEDIVTCLTHGPRRL